ncbi:MAG: hypothetical protein MI920_10605 [Kiloniellales bacterium]|nr:hypothetical protein [Kiloniellales bacterium]
MTRKQTKLRVPLDSIGEQFEKGVAGADSARAAEVQGFQRVRAAKATGMERARSRTAARLGEDHPRVAALDRKIDANRTLTRQLVFESERAVTETPKADPKGWSLHGHVRNADLTAAPGLTVALYDEKGQWLRELGHDCTDATGHFLLSYSVEKDDDERKDDKKKDPKEQRKVSVIARAATPKARFHVRVFSKKQEQLYQGPTDIAPAPGGVDYREIILGDEVCPPPEPSDPPKKDTDTKPRPQPRPRPKPNPGTKVVAKPGTKTVGTGTTKKQTTTKVKVSTKPKTKGTVKTATGKRAAKVRTKKKPAKARTKARRSPSARRSGRIKPS